MPEVVLLQFFISDRLLCGMTGVHLSGFVEPFLCLKSNRGDQCETIMPFCGAYVGTLEKEVVKE